MMRPSRSFGDDDASPARSTHALLPTSQRDFESAIMRPFDGLDGNVLETVRRPTCVDRARRGACSLLRESGLWSESACVRTGSRAVLGVI